MAAADAQTSPQGTVDAGGKLSSALLMPTSLKPACMGGLGVPTTLLGSKLAVSEPQAESQEEQKGDARGRSDQRGFGIYDSKRSHKRSYNRDRRDKRGGKRDKRDKDGKKQVGRSGGGERQKSRRRGSQPNSSPRKNKSPRERVDGGRKPPRAEKEQWLRSPRRPEESIPHVAVEDVDVEVMGGSMELTAGNLELERARVLVPSQPVVPKALGRRPSRDKRLESHFFPSRPPPISVDPHSIQALAQLTSPRHETLKRDASCSPRSLSPSPSPRDVGMDEKPRSSASRRARANFFQDLKHHEKQVRDGKCQLSMRSADDVFIAAKVHGKHFLRVTGRQQKPCLRVVAAKSSTKVGSSESVKMAKNAYQSSDSGSENGKLSPLEEEEERFMKELGWKDDDAVDALSEEEIASTKKELLDCQLSLGSKLPKTRLEMYRQMQNSMPAQANAAVASSPALLRFTDKQ